MTTPNDRTSPPAKPEGVNVYGRDEQMTEQYVTHDGYSPFNHIHALGPMPWHTYDTQRYVTPEELARMSRDPKIHKAKRIIVHGTLTDDFQFATGATENEAGSKANYDKFVDVMQFCERMVGGLETPYWLVMEQMLGGALEQGHKIGEVVWDYVLDKPVRDGNSTNRQKPRASLFGRLFGSWAPKAADTVRDGSEDTAPNRFAKRATVRLMPKTVHVLPWGAALFTVDDFMNVLGLVPAHKGAQSWAAADVITRDKFIVLTLNPEDSDPRGMSTWRPAYGYWHLAGHIPKNYLKLLLQEGMPIPVLTLPPKTDGWLTVKNDLGQIQYETVGGIQRPKLMSVAEAAEKTLEKMYLGKGVAIPNESKLEPYRKGGGNVGSVFENAIKVIYNLVEEAILLQPLAQSAGDVQSKSAAMIHADVLGDAFFWYKRAIAVMTLYDLCAVGVRVNLGEWALSYMPKLSLGDSEKRDWARDLEVLAKAFWYGFIDETQRAELMAWLGLPKPGPAPTEPKSGKATADVDGNPAPPADQRPDKSDRGRKQPGKTNADYREQFEEVTHRVEAYESSLHSVGHHAGRRKSFMAYLHGGPRSQGPRANA